MKGLNMRIKKYARDLKVGDRLYHWDGEGPAEPIAEIRQSYNRTHDGSRIINQGYLFIRCQTYNMLVHRNDIRKIEL